MKTQPSALVNLQVLRAFWLDGAVQPVGAFLQAPAGLAAELLNAHKARLAPEPNAAQAQATTDNSPKAAAPTRRRSNT
jgi:hypothetical protein